MALLGVAPSVSARGASGRQIHVVYSGQRLGSIAKRYNVTIEAICEANGIRRRDPIRPGQRLEIPSRDEKTPKPAASEAPAAPTAESKPKSAVVEPPRTNQGAGAKKAPVTKSEVQKHPERPKTVVEPSLAAVTEQTVVAPVFGGMSHRVQPGDSLSAIAVRYDTNVKTLLEVNRLNRDQVIRVGQVLTIPRAPANSWWAKFARSPRRAGEMDVYAHTNRWKGKVIVNGKVQSAGRAALSRLLGATGSAPPLPERLIQLLAHVSDTFGGRPIRLVSGYRTNSYFKDSRHRHSSAVDFSIEGVPNSAVRDYLLQLGNVGVGYYPNSSFVHLDVRARSAYWVDYAGPGEAPRKTPRGDTRLASKKRKFERKSATRAPVRRVHRKPAPTSRELDELGRVASAGMVRETPSQRASTDVEPTAPEPVVPVSEQPPAGDSAVNQEPPSPTRAKAKGESEPLAGRTVDTGSGRSDVTTTPTHTPGT